MPTAFRTALNPVAGPTDPYFSSVSLLLHMDGTNGSKTFTDSSNSAISVTANGNAQISTTQYKYGGASGSFNGVSTTYLSAPAGSAFNFGTGDFTIETWFYSNITITSPFILDLRTTFNLAWGFGSDSGNLGKLYWFNGTVYQEASATVSSGQWYHLAYSKSGSTGRTFINGNQAFTLTDTVNYAISNPTARFGIRYTGNSGTTPLNGYLDDFRVTKGVARYTSNFTPPTAAFPNS